LQLGGKLGKGVVSQRQLGKAQSGKGGGEGMEGGQVAQAAGGGIGQGENGGGAG